MAVSTKIFIGSLSQGVKPQELRRLFESYGVVTECDVMNRCGFVHMETADMAENAIRALNGTLFKGATIVVEPGRKKDTSKKGKTPRSVDRRRNRGSSRRRRNRNRGNPENRRNQAVMQPNDNNNPNINSEEALSICSALFLQVSKMLKPGVNLMGDDGLYQDGNNSSHSARDSAIEIDSLDINNQLSNVAKSLPGRKRSGRRHHRGNRGNQSQTGGVSSDNDSNRNKPQNNTSVGPVRNIANKPLNNIPSTPYNKEGPRNNNYNHNARGQTGGSGFGNQGNFRHKNIDQPKIHDIWQVGNNFNSERSFGNDMHNGNNMPIASGMGGMIPNTGNYGMNNLARERFRGNSESFGMGNQDRRGFALPERQNLDYERQQMGPQQQQDTIFRGGNQMPGRNFLNTGPSGQANMSFNNNQSDAIFTRRGDSFSSQIMNNRMSNQQQNFGFESQGGGLNRGSNFGNIGNGDRLNNLGGDGIGSFSNLRGGFESNSLGIGNNSRNFQNDFPPLGFGGSDLLNRNQSRQNMMSARRFN